MGRYFHFLLIWASGGIWRRNMSGRKVGPRLKLNLFPWARGWNTELAHSVRFFFFFCSAWIPKLPIPPLALFQIFPSSKARKTQAVFADAVEVTLNFCRLFFSFLLFVLTASIGRSFPHHGQMVPVSFFFFLKSGMSCAAFPGFFLLSSSPPLRTLHLYSLFLYW